MFHLRCSVCELVCFCSLCDECALTGYGKESQAGANAEEKDGEKRKRDKFKGTNKHEREGKLG